MAVHGSWRRTVRALAVGALVLAAAGCGGTKGYDRYIPPEDAARKALEAALDAWRTGAPPGRIDTTSPPVQVLDGHRRPGQKLLAYEVLGEVVGEGPRCYAVRLTLDDPPQVTKIRYFILGINPLLVWREEDYLMLIHWECAPVDGATQSKGTREE